MPRITRKFEFDSGHRVLGHEGKCAYLHGHRYVAEVTVDSSELDNIGRVIDFSQIKSIIGDWIDGNWDHNLILHRDDAMNPLNYDSKDPQYEDFYKLIVGVLAGRMPYIMKYGNPTAENMARELFEFASFLLPKELTVFRVRLYETPNCWADYYRTLSPKT